MNRRGFCKTALLTTALGILPDSGMGSADIRKETSPMLFRKLGRTGLTVSVLGLGIEGFRNKTAEETRTMIDYAAANGINFIDLCLADPRLLDNLKQAFGDRRKDWIIQGHIGTVWENGQYRRTRNLSAVEKTYNQMLKTFGGIIDIGMIHYVDAESDFERIFNGEFIAYAKNLKAAGKIRAIGLSTHNPVIGRLAVESGTVDVIMFSANLGYDLSPNGGQISYDEERQKFYELCARENVAIDVMKPYGGGNLLRAEISPFGIAFTPVQALNYALTRPAVAADSAAVVEKLKRLGFDLAFFLKKYEVIFRFRSVRMLLLRLRQ